jgi:hypothetical protein
LPFLLRVSQGIVLVIGVRLKPGIFPIIQQMCDSSVGQAVQTIIPDATATCQKINIEAQASLIGIELGYTLIILGPVVAVAGGLTTGRKYYRRGLANPPGLHLRLVDALDLAPEFGLKCNGDFDSIQEGFQLFHVSINSSSPFTCVM